MSNAKTSSETKALTPYDQFRNSMGLQAKQIESVLPKHIGLDKFIRITLTAVNQNQDLLACDRATLYAACMKAAEDGLLPDGREAAFVKFGQQVAYLPMVAGIMKKVRNSGEISSWSAHVVKANDEFSYELGDYERLVHKPALSDRGLTIGAYSIVKLKSGETTREFMNKDEIDSIRNRSRAKGSGPWQTDYDEMAKKTVIRRHAKRLPMSTDLEKTFEMDDEAMGVVEEEEDNVIAIPQEPDAPKRLKDIVSKANEDFNKKAKEEKSKEVS